MTAQTRTQSPSMSQIADDDDPRIHKVYRKLRMLMLIGALTMGVGFMAVMSVIAYRVVKSGGGSAGALTRHLDLPAGARVTSTAVEGGRLVVTTEAGTSTVVHVFDASSLLETGRLEIGPGAGSAAPPMR